MSETLGSLAVCYPEILGDLLDQPLSMIFSKQIGKFAEWNVASNGAGSILTYRLVYTGSKYVLSASAGVHDLNSPTAEAVATFSDRDTLNSIKTFLVSRWKGQGVARVKVVFSD